MKSFSSSLPEKQARIVQFSSGRARAPIHISKCQSVFVNVNLDETLGVKTPLFSASCLRKGISGLRWGVWSWHSKNCIAASLCSALDFLQWKNHFEEARKCQNLTISPYNPGPFFQNSRNLHWSLPSLWKEDHFWAPCKWILVEINDFSCICLRFEAILNKNCCIRGLLAVFSGFQSDRGF